MKIKLLFRHECDLTDNEQDVLAPSPYSSGLGKLRHRMFKYTTIIRSRRNEVFFRSNAAVRKERLRHLGTPRYRRIVHPLSYLALVKVSVTWLLWLCSLVLHPFIGSFLPSDILDSNHRPLFFVYVALQACLLADTVSRFYIGYVVQKTREIVLDPAKVARHYLRGYFLIDLVPCLPAVVLVVYPAVPSHYQFYLHNMHMVRALRTKTLVEYLDRTMKTCGIHQSIRLCVILSVMCTLVVHWWCCLLGFIPIMQNSLGMESHNTWTVHKMMSRKAAADFTIVDAYFHYLTMVLCHFFGVSCSRFGIADPIEMTIYALIAISGLVFYVYATARILQVFGTINVAEGKYEELVSQATEYMLRQKYSRKLRRRVIQYYEFKYDRTFFSAREILSTLSDHLRYEVLLYSCQYLINNLEIFRGLSRLAVGCILSLLEEEIYLSGDEVLNSAYEVGDLFFILYGTCAVQLTSGREAMHIDDGSEFGENKRFNVQKDILYRVVAVETSLIYVLRADNVKYCCKMYPEVSLKLEVLAKGKAKIYNAVLSTAETEEEIKVMDIITELRRGNILHRGLKRDVML